LNWPDAATPTKRFESSNASWKRTRATRTRFTTLPTRSNRKARRPKRGPIGELISSKSLKAGGRITPGIACLLVRRSVLMGSGPNDPAAFEQSLEKWRAQTCRCLTHQIRHQKQHLQTLVRAMSHTPGRACANGVDADLRDRADDVCDVAREIQHLSARIDNLADGLELWNIEWNQAQIALGLKRIEEQARRRGSWWRT